VSSAWSLGRSPAPSAPASAPPSIVAAPPQLTAFYRTENLQLTSYRVTITINNPSTVPATGWTIVTVLSLLDLTVRNVTGAVMTRTDLRVIFTPVDSTRTVKPGGTVVVSFEVEGLGVRNEPFNCTVDGRPCTAIPG
jgi:hypothetical protein